MLHRVIEEYEMNYDSIVPLQYHKLFIPVIQTFYYIGNFSIRKITIKFFAI